MKEREIVFMNYIKVQNYMNETEKIWLNIIMQIRGQFEY